MSQEQAFSDLSIKQAIESLTAQDQDVTPWAVQAQLGGGDYLKIQQVIEQYFTVQRAPPELAPSPLITPKAAPDIKTPTPAEPVNLIDQQMPASIEATMYQMQKTFGNMASQLWSDVAKTAQDQVQDEVSKAQQAQQTAESNQQQMQDKIQQLDSQLHQLDANLQTSVKTLEDERQQLISAERQRNQLQKEITTLSSDKQLLERDLLDANIKAAKAEGLADITREQLELAKQSEQQTRKSLDRSEKRVDLLDSELQNSQRELNQAQFKLDSSSQQRDELASKLHDSQLRQAAEQALRQELQERRLPQYNEPPAAIPQVSFPPAATASAPAPKAVVAEQQVTDLGHSFTPQKPTPAKSNTKDKSRSLSDKLFDRKSRQNNRKS